MGGVKSPVADIPKHISWKSADHISELGWCKFNHFGKKLLKYLFTVDYLENRDKQKEKKQNNP